MKKICCLCLILCLLATCSGCGKSREPERNVNGTVPSDETEMIFPDTYEKESESGKVRFNCQVEVPDQVKEEKISRISAEGLRCCDQEKAWAMFGEGKEISEQENYPVDEGRADFNYYIFEDESTLHIAEGISYGSGTCQYYSNINVFDPANVPLLEPGSVSFMSADQCVEEVKKTMEELGYQTDEFEFRIYPVNSDTMKELEEDLVNTGYISEENRKEGWSREDDAYAVYAYQKIREIPVFHEVMGLSRQMADDSPDNAPVQVIACTECGINAGCPDCDRRSITETCEYI